MTPRSLRRLRTRSKGGVLIEFALVLPVFLLLLLGTIDWGWYFVIRATVINATREGARIGAVAPDAATAATDASTAVQNYLRNAFGDSYVVAPTTADVIVGSQHCISVRLINYPVVPGRPTSSMTGLIAWTKVPTTISARTDMRLETQP